MPPEVNSFFVTKLAKSAKPVKSGDDPDKVIDPGEASAAGLAFASNPTAQRMIPFAGALALDTIMPERLKIYGAPLYGVKTIGGLEKQLLNQSSKNVIDNAVLEVNKRARGMPQAERVFVESLAKNYEAPKRSLLNLFKIQPYTGKGLALGPAKAVFELDKAQEVVDSMIKRYDLTRKGVTMDIAGGSVSRLTGPSYDPLKKKVRLPWTNEPYILHELGHAAHLTKPGATSLHAARKLIAGAAGIAVPMAYIAGNEIKKMFPGKIDDKVIDFVQQNAPSIIAATYAAAEMYPEVQATTRAVHHVHKTQGRAAAVKSLKALMPAMASYVLPIIPAMIGVSLAKKWYFEAQGKEGNQEKDAGILRDVGGFIRDTAVDLANNTRLIGADLGTIAGQVGPQAAEILKHPNEVVAKTLWDATIKNVKSPEFAAGAVMAGLPAAAMAYTYHNTQRGKVFRERLREVKVNTGHISKPEADLQRLSEVSKHDSFTFPAIVGITAAISGGALSKIYRDMLRVL